MTTKVSLGKRGAEKTLEREREIEAETICDGIGSREGKRQTRSRQFLFFIFIFMRAFRFFDFFSLFSYLIFFVNLLLFGVSDSRYFS